MGQSRTTLELSDERRTLEDKARGIDAIDEKLPPSQWRTTLYDLALTHLIESHRNLERVREDGEVSGPVIQEFNTSVLKYKYRSWIE